MTEGPAGGRALRLRRDDRCCRCGVALPAGTRAMWDAQTRTTRCVICPSPLLGGAPAATVRPHDGPTVVPNFGVPGRSAQREFESRESRRGAPAVKPASLAVSAGTGAAIGTALTLMAHLNSPVLILLFAGIGTLKSVEKPLRRPRHIKAWQSGAIGEQAIGARLETLRGEGVLTVHDRRIPGSRANIDHIAVAPSGIIVVDSKNHAGKVVVTRSGLTVAGRRCDEMVPGVKKQIAVVRQALADQPLPPDLVRGVLCFTRADLPWLRPAPGGVQLLHRKGLARLLRRPGPLTPEQVQHLAETLACRLPPA
jgi:hypothetical protein